MRYFLISDVHGEYTKMVQALKDAGFNKDNDTLVSLGDLFDRGYENVEVLNYILSLPHTILIGGNHDFRLEDLYRLYSASCTADIHNGTIGTIRDFVATDEGFYGNQKLNDYFERLVGAVEFSNYIATHAWVLGAPQEPDYDWRDNSMRGWKYGSWVDSYEHWSQFKDFPDKKMIIGHFHACLFRSTKPRNQLNMEELQVLYGNKDNHNIFEDEHIVVIDGCSNLPCGKVNVFIIDDDPANVKTYGYNRPMHEEDF